MQPKRLEFVVTRQCSGRCPICTDTGSQGGTAKLDATLAARVLEDLSARYLPDMVVTLGGEPLLYADTVCSIQREAARLNVPCRRLITNGYFSKSPERIAQVAQNLVEAGLTQILLTVDSFHQTEIPLETVRLFAEALLDAGFYDLQLHPAWYLSQEDDNPQNRETRRLLDSLSDTGVEVGEGYVVNDTDGAGEASQSLVPAENGEAEGGCAGSYPMAALRVEPDGRVLCCRRNLGQVSHQDSVLPLLADCKAEG